MTNLSIDTHTNSGAGTSGLLNHISIPETSPITSDYSPLHIPLPSDMQAAASDNQNSTTSPSTSTSAPIITNTDSAPAAAANTSLSPPAPSSDPELQITVPDPATMSSSSSPPPDTAAAGPALTITLLLTSGSRHPYKIDEKYLNKRGVNVPDVTEAGRKDPFSISVYTLKELILREWRDEWEAKPSSPSSIRLIFFGRLLDDKLALRECKFNPDGANIVHMTVTPQDLVDEEEAAKGGSSRGNREGSEATAGCRCVIL
ncbi:ubiquitin protein [Rutstroemia sp. NJR-2017a BBW]|nr:ubiquitin protein [Rutstroemia sp. NJR-2017a BBW]